MLVRVRHTAVVGMRVSMHFYKVGLRITFVHAPAFAYAERDDPGEQEDYDDDISERAEIRPIDEIEKRMMQSQHAASTCSGSIVPMSSATTMESDGSQDPEDLPELQKLHLRSDPDRGGLRIEFAHLDSETGTLEASNLVAFALLRTAFAQIVSFHWR